MHTAIEQLEDLESGGTGSHDPQAGLAADGAKRSESETEMLDI